MTVVTGKRELTMKKPVKLFAAFAVFGAIGTTAAHNCVLDTLS
jgi:hypothetical protein